jgi:hypothetical protein
MSTLSPVMDAFGFSATSDGFSMEANVLEQRMWQSVVHFLEPRLNLLIPEIEGLAGECDGGRSADRQTVRAAIRFAYCLPRFGPLPEVSVDPDGEISFDWVSRSGEIFSVSVNRHNRLAYAGWFGEKSRTHGIEQLAESCPSEIIRGIQRATLSERQSGRATKALHGNS